MITIQLWQVLVAVWIIINLVLLRWITTATGWFGGMTEAICFIGWNAVSLAVLVTWLVCRFF